MDLTCILSNKTSKFLQKIRVIFPTNLTMSSLFDQEINYLKFAQTLLD